MQHLENIIELSCPSGWNCIAVNCTMIVAAAGVCAVIFMITYLIEETIKGIKK